MGPITFLANQFQQLINRVEVYKSNTLFETFPLIRGWIFIRNNDGLIILGEQVTFNCAVTTNFAGMFKTSTIYMEPDACLQIGDRSGFSGVSIYCSRSITIGKNVNCGSNVCIWDTDFYPLNYLERRVHKREAIHKKPIVIGDDVFIGGNSIILKGVSIGARSVIGAGSIVTKCVPADEVWAGNPARFIKRINW